MFTAENSARRGDDSTSQQIFTAENSAKRGDDGVPTFFLPLKIQPGEEMTLRHNKFLPLKIQPSEGMTVSQYCFYR